MKTICGVISNSNKEFENIYEVKTKSPFSQIDTASKEYALAQEKKKNIKFEVRKVKNYHINDIFKKVGKINVLNIDIEGKDFECISSSNLEIIDPEFILIEDSAGYHPSKKMADFFSERNYHLISICGKTKCYGKK